MRKHLLTRWTALDISLNDALASETLPLDVVARDWMSETSELLVSRIAEIDEQLRLIENTLEEIQPKIPGRVQIAWWRDRHYKRRDGEPVPERPYFVRMRRSRAGVFYQQELPAQRITLRVATKPGFAPVTVHVRELLSLACELIEFRWALWRQVTKAAELKNRFERNNGERLEMIRQSVFRLSQAAANDEASQDERCAVGA